MTPEDSTGSGRPLFSANPSATHSSAASSATATASKSSGKASNGKTTSSRRSNAAGSTKRSHRKSSLTDGQRQMIAAVCVMGCVLVAVTSDAAPTGHMIIDALYRCGFMVATVLAASRARRWSLVIASGLVLIGSTTFMLVPAIAGIVLAGALAWEDRRDRVLGAVSGLLVAWCALNLVWPTSTGSTALLAAAAVVPLWFSGYRVARSSSRRRIRFGLLACACVVVVGVAIAGVVVITQRKVLNTAASQTIAAAKGMTESSTAESAQSFAGAADRFDSAASTASAIWTYPARLVPVVAQNLHAVGRAAESGAAVTRTVSHIAGSVDYNRLQLDSGGIDLATLASFEGPVTRAEGVLRGVDRQIADLDSPWILGPLRSKLDQFATETARVRSGAETAAIAVKKLPAILGGSGERRYLLLLGNPAEARDVGGHLGTFAEITANNGTLKVVRVVSPYAVFGPGATPSPQIRNPIGLPPAMLEMNPTRFPQNWGASPSMDDVARVAADLYPQSTIGAPLDGVLYADPYAFAAVLRVVGPVNVTTAVASAGIGPSVISADNAVAYLTRDQFAIDHGAEDPVKGLVETALDRLTSDRLPAVKSVVDSFGKVVEQGRLQFRSLHGVDEPLLRRLGLDQPFTQPRGGDLLAVISRSAFPSKIDSYLKRQIHYRVAWDPTSGVVESVVDIDLTNAAPRSGLPSLISAAPAGSAPGTISMVLSVITPFEIDSATVEGRLIPVGTRSETGDLKRHSFLIDIAPESSQTVTVRLRGSVTPGHEYQLSWFNQPLVNRDQTRFTIKSLGSPFVGGDQSGKVKVPDERMARLMLRTKR